MKNLLNDKKVDKKENDLYIKYEQYKNEKDINLKKFKHPVLKETCKQYALKVTGNKTVLTERIESLFKKIKNAIVIQSMIKRYQWKIFYNYVCIFCKRKFLHSHISHRCQKSTCKCY